MAFLGLVLDDNGQPDDKQPVPLRLASFIGGWTVHEFFSCLTSLNPVLGFKCIVYQYEQGSSNPIVVNPAVLLRLYQSYSQQSESQFVQAIHTDYFIWSDDVKNQINAYARNILGGDDDARLSGFIFDWNPALGNHQNLVNNSSDFHALLTTKQKRKATTRSRTKTHQVQYQSWCKEYKRLKAVYQAQHGSNAKYSYQQAASKLQSNSKLNPKNRSQTHIAKMLGRHCK